jgi:hypothetical protein
MRGSQHLSEDGISHVVDVGVYMRMRKMTNSSNMLMLIIELMQ